MHPTAAHQFKVELLPAADGEQMRAVEEYTEGAAEGHAGLDVDQLAPALKAGPDQ